MGVKGASATFRLYLNPGVFWLWVGGAVMVLGQRAIFDVPTAAIALVGLGLLWRFRTQEPILVAGAGVLGLVLYPLFRG